ncbi:hypothetical protein, partial [Streptomyces sp. NPDC088246]|uniref:hypothetical protein n=1 Tax=Streptomyces sp. NPDC088246 TaxID=3365842 RepID=UPI0037FA8AD9
LLLGFSLLAPLLLGFSLLAPLLLGFSLLAPLLLGFSLLAPLLRSLRRSDPATWRTRSAGCGGVADQAEGRTFVRVSRRAGCAEADERSRMNAAGPLRALGVARPAYAPP